MMINNNNNVLKEDKMIKLNKEKLEQAYKIVMEEYTLCANNISNPSTSRLENKKNDLNFEQLCTAAKALQNVMQILEGE